MTRKGKSQTHGHRKNITHLINVFQPPTRPILNQEDVIFLKE